MAEEIDNISPSINSNWSTTISDTSNIEINTSTPSTSQAPNRKRCRSQVSTQAETNKSVKSVKTTVKKMKLDFNWKKSNFAHEVDIPENPVFSELHECSSPLSYFEKFINDDCLQNIVENSNLYSTTQRGKSLDTTVPEIREFIGIELLMGLVSMNAYTDYWSNNLRYDQIADVMSLKRYQALRRYLHFVEEENADKSDRYYKIRPILEHVRKNCLAVEHEQRFSIDEMMVPYKGTRAGSRRQYIKNKPRKWGFKLFVRSGVSGFVYDILPYGGENTFHMHTFTEWEEKFFGLGQKVVLVLCRSIPKKALSVVYFDNWFTSMELLYYLRNEYGILALGTLQKPRGRGCKLKDDKELSKLGRGNFDFKCDNKKQIVYVKWLDNKCVNIASTYVSINPIKEVQRYKKDVKERVPVQCPKIIVDYNAHMGGVDLADMLISLYRTKMKTHRWYLAIFSQLLDICTNNAWLLYRRQMSLRGEKHMPLKEFRYQIAITLIKKDKVRVGRPLKITGPSRIIRKPSIKRPDEDIRYDNVDHFPNTCDRERCKLCQKKTIFICTKCKMHLCIVKERNCFYTFHKK